MTRLILLPLLWCLAAFALPAPAAAQDGSNPPPDARFHLGPVGLQPRFRVTNVGIDTNVLNASSNPMRDFTATFIPELDESLRVGRSSFDGKTSLAFVYFQKLHDQRSADWSQDMHLALHLTRITPYLRGAYLTSNQRPNLEIDARVHNMVTTFGAGVTTRLTPVVSLDVSGVQDEFAYDDVTYNGSNLATVLDRTTRGAAARVLVDLTPLTTFVLQTAASQDRFPSSPERNSDSAQVMAGFTMKRSALLSGTANVGVKWFQPNNAAIQDFTGVVADVGLSYLFRDRTQISGRLARGTDYSYEIDLPYYVSTVLGLTVTQILVGHVDMVAHAAGTLFDYRTMTPAGGSPAPAGRRDRVSSFGIGFGYRLAAGSRIGFDMAYDRRLSPVADLGYQGFHFGGSFTYGY